MEEYQFELGGVTFGAGTIYPVGNIEGLGTGSRRERSNPNPGEDGVAFGREYRDLSEITFLEAGVKVPGDPAGAWDALATLTDAFQADDVRRTARAVIPLTLCRPGAPARVLYGRPGAFDPDVKLSIVGWIPWQGSFRVSDPLFYAEEERVLDVSIAGGETGGLFPTTGGGLLVTSGGLVGVGQTETQKAALNGGTRDTWPVIEFTGPVAAPTCEIHNELGGVLWRIGLTTNIAAGKKITVDTRPWRRTVLGTDGASYAGALTRESWLSRSKIPPGTFGALFRGTDATGTANMRVTTRDAFSTI